MVQRLGDLEIAEVLYDFVMEEALPGTGLSTEAFWRSFEGIVQRLAPINDELLGVRDQLQQKIDQWYLAHPNKAQSPAAVKAFLEDIGYIAPTPKAVQVSTEGVDPEIASIAGPQLVVPVMNARYALNAANARWGSLYDALYGTDVIGEEGGAEKGSTYNPVRGAKVVAYAADFLDRAIPLTTGSHAQITGFSLKAAGSAPLSLFVGLEGGAEAQLQVPECWIGFVGEQNAPASLLFKHHHLHIEIQLDANHPIGQVHPAGIKDVILESAITTIQDCEDSVAAVDAEDKTTVYRNWLGLMKGSLTTEFNKGGKTVERALAADRVYQDPEGQSFTLSGRSLMLVRNVGLLMKTDAVLYQGQPIPEGILDAMLTSLIALHDLQKSDRQKHGAVGELLPNSQAGSVYIVKPKMHGPAEVAFSVSLFEQVEQALGLSKNTLKMGIMDEEKRTTVNLKACINEARERVIFINTGFLDRTGDEIHTGMEAGPFIPKPQMKNAQWIAAYEAWNVDMGLQTGCLGHAQIGKGMWPKPDEMAQMVATKQAHPLAGASCAWVPSPTAATLHAMHYHDVNVASVQQELLSRKTADLLEILTLPLVDPKTLTAEQIQEELDNNAQGILGYVVRWIDQGVGCSKVPDIHNVGLMEDRATLRISSQYIANWLHHGVVTKAQVEETFARMAKVVDEQNNADVAYQPMSDDLANSIAFKASCELVFEGCKQPNGYTEPVLHKRRLEKKSS